MISSRPASGGDGFRPPAPAPEAKERPDATQTGAPGPGSRADRAATGTRADGAASGRRAESEEHRPNSAVEQPPVEGLGLNLNLGRLAWLATVATLVVGGVLLALRGDYGYASVAGVVALAAAINVF